MPPVQNVTRLICWQEKAMNLNLCLCRLSSLNMTPEETPDLHFLADSRSLRQAITSFGCISAQVMYTPSCMPTSRCCVWRWHLLWDILGEVFTELSCLQLIEGVSSQNSTHQPSQMQSCPVAAKKQVNGSPCLSSGRMSDNSSALI